MEWALFSKELDNVTIPASILTDIVGCVPDADLQSLGAWYAHSVYKPAVLIKFGKFTFESLIESLRIMSDSSGLFSAEVRSDGKSHVVALKHRMQRKWGIFLRGMLESLFHDLVVGIETRLEAENVLILEIHDLAQDK